MKDKVLIVRKYSIYSYGNQIRKCNAFFLILWCCLLRLFILRLIRKYIKYLVFWIVNWMYILPTNFISLCWSDFWFFRVRGAYGGKLWEKNFGFSYFVHLSRKIAEKRFLNICLVSSNLSPSHTRISQFKSIFQDLKNQKETFRLHSPASHPS